MKSVGEPVLEARRETKLYDESEYFSSSDNTKRFPHYIRLKLCSSYLVTLDYWIVIVTTPRCISLRAGIEIKIT